MSIQTQAILSGHLRPEDIVTAVASLTGCNAAARPMHKTTYQLIEIMGPAGPEALHLFLDSSVAEDYRDVTGDPSTFVSAQLSPFASATLKRLTEAFGGFYRHLDQDDWERIDPITAR